MTANDTLATYRTRYAAAARAFIAAVDFPSSIAAFNELVAFEVAEAGLPASPFAMTLMAETLAAEKVDAAEAAAEAAFEAAGWDAMCRAMPTIIR